MPSSSFAWCTLPHVNWKSLLLCRVELRRFSQCWLKEACLWLKCPELYWNRYFWSRELRKQRRYVSINSRVIFSGRDFSYQNYSSKFQMLFQSCKTLPDLPLPQLHSSMIHRPKLQHPLCATWSSCLRALSRPCGFGTHFRFRQKGSWNLRRRQLTDQWLRMQRKRDNHLRVDRVEM